MLARQKATWLELGVRPTSEAAALLLPASPDKPEALLKPAAASKRFHEAATACGLPDLSLHDLRHLHGSALLAVLPPSAFQDRCLQPLGHASQAPFCRFCFAPREMRATVSLAVKLKKRY
jgi:hypothetical protein